MDRSQAQHTTERSQFLLSYADKFAQAKEAGKLELTFALAQEYINVLLAEGKKGCPDMKKAAEYLLGYNKITECRYEELLVPEWQVKGTIEHAMVKRDLTKGIASPEVVEFFAPRKEEPPSTTPTPGKEVRPQSVGRQVIIFDFESNGLANCSILSATALRVHFDAGLFILGKVFNRFYYPEEPYNEKALSVNGLRREVVEGLRGEAEYAARFAEDQDWEEFCSTAQLFVAHNVKFDRKFMLFDLPAVFCTMESNTGKDKVKTRWNPKYQKWQWPKLAKTAEHYGIEVKEGLLHCGFYDVFLCFEVFRRMYKRGDPDVRQALEGR